MVSRDFSKLDLAFVLDTTSSMGGYIQTAKDNILKIAEAIVKSEKCQLRIALINYRDHPPQEKTYITQVNEFTDDMVLAKKYVTKTHACGGGDRPESVCCGLNDCCEKLKWREEAIKIAILIADAPPHGLGSYGDGFPQGCPLKVDPVETCHKMAANGITLYVAGCEPALTPYRQFFIAMTLVTGGFYVPLNKTEQLTDVIVNGARCEVSMEKMMAQVHEEVMREAAEKGNKVNEDELTKRIHELLNSRKDNNIKKIENCDDIEITDGVKELSKLKTLKEVVDKANEKGIILINFPKILKKGFSSIAPTSESSFTPMKHPVKPLPSRKTIIKKRVIKESRVIRKIAAKIVNMRKANPKLLGLYEINGIRRSCRVNTEVFKAKTPCVVRRVAKRPLEEEDTGKISCKKLKSNNHEKINELDVRRLVKKSIARNKLCS